ncbi:hypothetical protein JCM5350_001950 [Sporobolomyces pararoseus]
MEDDQPVAASSQQTLDETEDGPATQNEESKESKHIRIHIHYSKGIGENFIINTSENTKMRKIFKVAAQRINFNSNEIRIFYNGLSLGYLQNETIKSSIPLNEDDDDDDDEDGIVLDVTQWAHGGFSLSFPQPKG